MMNNILAINVLMYVIMLHDHQKALNQFVNLNTINKQELGFVVLLMKIKD